MTHHGIDCTMTFGRKSPEGCCARCDELRAGAAPREGWQKKYFEKKARAEVRANLPHDCISALGLVCACKFVR